ncbi:MAG: TIGR01777 family oxidoreductase [Bacteroidia bacterium]|nr:TIGR01777 family oxidoreductase [Bacteroidia bacterium]NNJ55657.1 TIGR01777 family protein [Bacteroidia bacterium]
MKIIIAGGSGFIGTYLQKRFIEEEHQVYVLTRNPKTQSDVLWDGRTIGSWINYLEGANVLINMAGKSVDCRYHAKNREAILNSRIESTSILSKAISQLEHPPDLWINSSTATIYRHSLDKPMDEQSGEIGSGFSVDVAIAWEQSFFSSAHTRTRKVALRTAITLGKSGGAYVHFRSLTKVGFGGSQGDGSQMVSWVHEEDLYRAISFIMGNSSIEGILNVSAPNPISNQTFMETYRNHFNPYFNIRIRKWMLEIGAFFLRTETELLLKSRWVIPGRLTSLGFVFKYDTIQKAISHLN